MTTFRFRGKTNKGKWVEGDLINSLDGYKGIFTNERIKYYVIPSTVGLISSMPDSTGKLIAQGDLVKFNNDNKEYEVDFDGVCFCVSIDNKNDVSMINFTSWSITIVGTIHDNF